MWTDCQQHKLKHTGLRALLGVLAAAWLALALLVAVAATPSFGGHAQAVGTFNPSISAVLTKSTNVVGLHVRADWSRQSGQGKAAGSDPWAIATVEAIDSTGISDEAHERSTYWAPRVRRAQHGYDSQAPPVTG
jgi:hypothetical protein